MRPPGSTYTLTVAAVYDGVRGAFSAPITVTTLSPSQPVDRVLAPGWNTLSLPYSLTAASLSALQQVINQASIAYVYTGGGWQQATVNNEATLLTQPMTGWYIDEGVGPSPVAVTLTSFAA